MSHDMVDDHLPTETTPLIPSYNEFKEDETIDKRLYWILPALAIGSFLGAADQTLIISSYTKIGSELNALNKTNWLATAYLLPLSSFQLLYGRLCDIFGRKPIFIFAYLTFGLGCLFCGLARTMDELIVARALTGMAGGFNTLASIVVSDMIPLRKRGTWQGYRNLVFALGLGAGSLGGGVLADNMGWRWSFLLQVPFALVGLLNVSLALEPTTARKDSLQQRLRRIDFAGALTIVGAVSALLVGLDQGSDGSWDSPTTAGCLFGALLLFVAFLFVETRVASEPFAPARVLFQRSIFACLSSNFCAYAFWLAALYYMPLYWQAVEMASATQASVRLLPGFVAGVAGSLLAGAVMQRTGRFYWLTVISTAAMTLGAALLVLFTGLLTSSLVGVLVGFTICGFTLNIGSTSTLVALMSHSSKEDQAVAISCLHLFRSLGSEVALALCGAIVQVVLRSSIFNAFSDKSEEEITTVVEHVRRSLDYIHTLDPGTQDIVRGCYGMAVRWCLVLSAGFAVSTFLACLAIREQSLATHR